MESIGNPYELSRCLKDFRLKFPKEDHTFRRNFAITEASRKLRPVTSCPVSALRVLHGLMFSELGGRFLKSALESLDACDISCFGVASFKADF